MLERYETLGLKLVLGITTGGRYAQGRLPKELAVHYESRDHLLSAVEWFLLAKGFKAISSSQTVNAQQAVASFITNALCERGLTAIRKRPSDRDQQAFSTRHDRMLTSEQAPRSHQTQQLKPDSRRCSDSSGSTTE